MASEESDDEPLSNIAASKKLDPEKFEKEIASVLAHKHPKKKKKHYKKLGVTIRLKKHKTEHSTVLDRPADVWMYLKDLKPTGPYSCLLCPEWFINRSKIIIHYVLNHNKDFCGICRYFVLDRESWEQHKKFHTPWPCSQCSEAFETEEEARTHLSLKHKLVHCRLCHFRLPDDDQYNTHLYQKHNVTNSTSKNEEIMWDFEYEGSHRFLCLLCSKSDNPLAMFWNHFMGYHHFTIKCFTAIISGRNLPFTVNGVNVSAEFMDALKEQTRYGYMDSEQTLLEPGRVLNVTDPTDILKVLIPEIKQEPTSESEEVMEDAYTRKLRIMSMPFECDYKGDEDFDVTLTELIILENKYFDYVAETINNINAKVVPALSSIDYASSKLESAMEDECALCKTTCGTVYEFVAHATKMHVMKFTPLYTCRICVATFEAENELNSHVAEELKEFDDLWLCQFCDKEFDNREATRMHLNEHIDQLEYDNCFSPHLGFKCKFCPTLFWNETDRETHQVRVHKQKYTDQFYTCMCSETFSDKVWFTHHFFEKHVTEDYNPLYLMKCCICCLITKTIDEMRDHFNLEHPDARKIFCSMDNCKYRPLSQRKSFKIHLKTLHNPEVRNELSTVCRECGKEFKTVRSCGAHIAQAHGKGGPKSSFKCKFCSAALQTLDERKLHYLIRHPGQHPFECKECGRSFQYKSSLYIHKQEHSPNKTALTCPHCSKVFMKKDSYKEHLMIHEGPRHACSYCPMRFVQRSNMLRHERRHTGEKPYECPQCPKTFSDKGACNSHARTHSEATRYACMYCGQTFLQKSKLTYHIRKHTGENLESCPVCSKIFTSMCSLREHMKIHTRKDENVKCPLCDKIYKNSDLMARHLRTTHVRPGFECPLCDRVVNSPSGLREHVLTHSKVAIFKCKHCSKSCSTKRTIVRHLRRRHTLKVNETSAKEHFKQRDVTQLKLGIDSVTLTRIFGPPPPKKPAPITKVIEFAPKEEEEEEEEEDRKEASEEEEEETEKEDRKSNANENSKDGETKDELEPTDFVCVKIEPVDEFEDADMSED